MNPIFEIEGEEEIMRQMKSFAAITGRSMLQEIKTTALTLCVALAKGTLPIGLSKAVHEKQKTRISFGVMDSVILPGDIYEELKNTNEALAGPFWNAVKSNNDPEAVRLMRTAGINHPYTTQPEHGMHWKSDKKWVEAKALAAYTAKIQKQAGRAKAGWAMAADAATGGHRGIPLWASGRKHPDAAGGASIIDDPVRPQITIYNNVSYIEDAMRATSVHRTLKIAYEKLWKRINIIYKKHAASTFKPAA